MTINFGDISAHLGTRFAGASVREKIITALNNNEQITYNFKDVETCSNSFADECFAKLIWWYSFDFIKQMTTFENASPFIKSVIANAYKERLSMGDELCKVESKGEQL